MRIEQDIKLDYKDVLFKPKRSKLESRRDVDLTRTFKFHHGNEWTGVPIMMNTTTKVFLLWQVTWTVLVHLKWQIHLLNKVSLLVLVKTYSADELVEFFNTDRTSNDVLNIRCYEHWYK